MNDPDQQLLPGLSLEWLTDCANNLADARSEVQHMHRLAVADDLGDLAKILGEARTAMMAAERMAAQLARKHNVARGLVSSVERDAP